MVGLAGLIVFSILVFLVVEYTEAVMVLVAMGIVIGIIIYLNHQSTEKAKVDREIKHLTRRAQKRNVAENAERVLKSLGDKDGAFNDHYSDDHIEIRKSAYDMDQYFTGDWKLTITLVDNGKIIFCLHGYGSGLGMTAYIPGAWEKHLDALLPKCREADKKKKKKEIEDKKKSFGLK